MTLQEFRKTVVKANWYDKYYYYLISVVVIIGSIYLFYDITTNPIKYKSRHSYEIALIGYFFLFFLGCYSIYLIPNRYKVLIINCNSIAEEKKKIVSEVLQKLNAPEINDGGSFHTFKYHRKWWTSDYDVYLYFDTEKFFVSVVGNTHGQGGFIDFGGAERLRKKIVRIINSSI